MRLELGLTCLSLLAACTDRADTPSDSGTESSPTTADGESSATTATPVECPDAGPATAEFWLDPAPAAGQLACSVTSVRLASDDLDVEIDLDCGEVDPNTEDTGPTPIPSTIKLGPSVQRPEIQPDIDVELVAGQEAAFCGETSTSFSLHRSNGELIAAGVMPTTLEATVPTGAAGALTLAYVVEDGCPHIAASLGATTVELQQGSSMMIAEGDTRLQIDVGRWGESPGESDDCGGSPVLFDAIVMRLP